MSQTLPSTDLCDASPYVTDNYAPVAKELTATDLEVIGELPKQLEGRLLRNGPNPIDDVDMAMHHWFFGDGMVHGVRLRDGKAEWYRNRYVASQRTTELLGQTTPRPAQGTMGPNTNVIGHGGRTYAIIEAGGAPVELTYELDSIGDSDFGGTLANGFSAHPKYDPLTGEMHAMCYAPLTLGDTVQHVVVNAEGVVTKTLPITLPTVPMIHDMGLTQRYALVLDLSVALDAELAMAGSPFPFRFQHDYNARVGLLPRSAESQDEITWCSVSGCAAFHPLNSYDLDDGRVIMDICAFPTLFEYDRNGPFRDGMPKLERWTIDPATASVTRDVIDERPQEFPRVATSVLNQQHRFGYAGLLDVGEASFNYGNTVMYDFDAGTSVVHDHGSGRQAGEPLFIRRENATAENDGWVMTTVFDQAENRSEVVLLEAQDLAADPVARVLLPARIPHGFHGNWVPDRVTPPA